MTTPPTSSEAQRLDRWLWHARLFKTRTIASRAIADHGARVTRAGRTDRVDKPSFLVRPGDHVTVSRGTQVLVVEIVGIGERRGPAPEAQALYVDHSPPMPPRPLKADSGREPGAGRPTKKDRRTLDRLRDLSEDG